MRFALVVIKNAIKASNRMFLQLYPMRYLCANCAHCAKLPTLMSCTLLYMYTVLLYSIRYEKMIYIYIYIYVCTSVPLIYIFTRIVHHSSLSSKSNKPIIFIQLQFIQFLQSLHCNSDRQWEWLRGKVCFRAHNRSQLPHIGYQCLGSIVLNWIQCVSLTALTTLRGLTDLCIGLKYRKRFS